MATSIHPAPCPPDKKPTLRSFPSLPRLTRRSMDSSSMKSRKSFFDLFVPARRFASGKPTPTPGSKLNQASEPAENKAIAHAIDVEAGIRSKDAQNKPAVKQRVKVVEPTSQEPLRRARTKSRTILRAISTTFRSRSPVPSTSPPRTSLSSQAKQNREDALRERGLLPPKPNKDLSRQEADLDRHIPVIPPDCTQADKPMEPSAADLIRRDWEAKNKTGEDSSASAENEERERMKSFRFGTPSPIQSPITTNFPRSTQLETVTETSSPLPSPLLDNLTEPPAPPQVYPPRKSSHRSSASAEQNLQDSTSIPLPPSPFSTPPKPTGPRSMSISSASKLPPTSFQPVRYGDTDSSSSRNGHNRSGSHRSSSSAPHITNPVISLTPPDHMNSSGQLPATSSSHWRSESTIQKRSTAESTSSMMTPSLDASPGSPTTISTLNTAESFSAVSGPSPAGGPKGKHGLLKVKTTEQVHNIPMIVESPVEDVCVIPDPITLPLSPISESNSPTLAVPTQPPPLTRRGRGLTDSGNREKRKLFNPFKRGLPSEPDDSDGNSRKISVSSSFSNLRRVASNFTKPRTPSIAGSMAPSTWSGRAKTFDASHLPPSPTVPSHFNSSGPGSGSTAVGLTPPNRRPLGPTLHSRGSILMEMNAIKDDETRRMTEVAFLN